MTTFYEIPTNISTIQRTFTDPEEDRVYRRFEIINIIDNHNGTVTLTNDNTIFQNSIKDIIFPICKILNICKWNRLFRKYKLTILVEELWAILDCIENAEFISEDNSVIMISADRNKIFDKLKKIRLENEKVFR